MKCLASATPRKHLQSAPQRWRSATLLLCALAISGCQSLSPVSCPQVPELPAHLQKLEPNLLQRLQRELQPLEPTEITPSDS